MFGTRRRPRERALVPSPPAATSFSAGRTGDVTLGWRPHGPRQSSIELTVEGFQPRDEDSAGRPVRGPPSHKSYARISETLSSASRCPPAVTPWEQTRITALSG